MGKEEFVAEALGFREINDKIVTTLTVSQVYALIHQRLSACGRKFSTNSNYDQNLIKRLNKRV
jgi:hypothetical protein